jgi:hypothetical protein
MRFRTIKDFHKALRDSTDFGRKSFGPREMLWSAVIVRAFNDAAWVPDDVDTARNYVENHLDYSSALVWLRGNTKDFMTVCEFANINPGYVRRLARERFGDRIDELQTPVTYAQARAIVRERDVDLLKEGDDK